MITLHGLLLATLHASTCGGRSDCQYALLLHARQRMLEHQLSLLRCQQLALIRLPIHLSCAGGLAAGRLCCIQPLVAHQQQAPSAFQIPASGRPHVAWHRGGLQPSLEVP